MTITLSQGGEVLSVTGNTCKRGEEYARQEMLAPTRTLTSTVKLDGGLYRRLPVITSSNIPKNRIMDVMQEINRVSARAPVQRGQILIEDVCGLGVNIIASRSIQKSEQ
jgi:CxxC motif-containing protein